MQITSQIYLFDFYKHHSHLKSISRLVNNYKQQYYPNKQCLTLFFIADFKSNADADIKKAYESKEKNTLLVNVDKKNFAYHYNNDYNHERYGSYHYNINYNNNDDDETRLLNISLCSFKESEGRIKEVYSSVHNALSIHLAQYSKLQDDSISGEARTGNYASGYDSQKMEDIVLPLENILLYFECEFFRFMFVRLTATVWIYCKLTC